MDNKCSVIIGPLRPKGMEVTPVEKAEWVRRFKESGLSLRKFSEQYGLRQASLWQWTSKYSSAGVERANTPGFVEVPLPSALASEPAWSVELTFANGNILRMCGEVPAGILQQVLSVC
jgi:transposase-like protein